MRFDNRGPRQRQPRTFMYWHGRMSDVDRFGVIGYWQRKCRPWKKAR